LIWFFQDLDRSRREREAIDDLANRADWLTVLGWRFDDSMRLVVDADLSVAGMVRPVTLRYPEHFPNIPALVVPRDTDEQWSTHQYGAGGELCLEWGPDNWQPEIMGANMLESAYRLLSGETPAPDQKGRVPSRHKTTLGQQLRGDLFRLLVTRDFQTVINDIPENALWSGTLVGTYRRAGIVLGVKSIQRNAADTWIAPAYPADLLWEDGTYYPFALIRWPKDSAAPPAESRAVFLDAIRARHPELPADTTCVLLARGEQLNVYTILNSDDDKCRSVSVIPSEETASRLDDDHHALAGRSVALIGCGSVGSKLGLMLARAGVGRFVLIDDDLMLPDNLVRNALDWRDVGYHKALALSRQIRLVKPDADIDAREHRLGGQTSTGGIETILQLIGKCDLIIDATADPHVFNYLAAAATLNEKPMIWTQVYGGGIGGMIARHRPTKEPGPAAMRTQIEQWCAQRGQPIVHDTIDYASRASGKPLIADDADVSVIAAHTARFAIDTLMPRVPSAFPSPVYLIGMREGWIFSQPFEVWPIDVGSPPIVEPARADDAAMAQEILRLAELYTKKKNEAAAPTINTETPAA